MIRAHYSVSTMHSTFLAHFAQHIEILVMHNTESVLFCIGAE